MVLRMKYETEFKQQAIALSRRIGVRRASEQLKIPYNTLADWRKKQNRFGAEAAFSVNGMPRPVITADQRTGELEKRNALLQRENDILQQVLAFFSGPKEATVYLRYRFIAEHQDEETVSELCRVLQVSQSGYYRYIKDKQAKNEKE